VVTARSACSAAVSKTSRAPAVGRRYGWSAGGLPPVLQSSSPHAAATVAGTASNVVGFPNVQPASGPSAAPTAASALRLVGLMVVVPPGTGGRSLSCGTTSTLGTAVFYLGPRLVLRPTVVARALAYRSTVVDTHPEGPDGNGSERSRGWTVPSPSTARTTTSWAAPGCS
jgi:hypothetical protein